MSSPGFVMAFNCPVKFKPAHTPLRHRVQRQLRAPGGARAPRTAGFTFVPHASSGRASGAMGAAKSPQRSFSVMQSAMKIPGLASALHLIGVNGPGGGTASGDSTVAAAGSGASGGLPAPGDSSPQPIARQLDRSVGASSASGSGSGGEPTPVVASAAASAPKNAAAAAAAAEVVYELAAVASSSNGNGNGNGNGHQPHSNHHQRTAQTTSVRHFNGYTNGFGHLRGGGGGGSDLDEPMSVVDPGSRTENNITPYTVGVPSLAGQIREIASTLRQINSLRMDYVDKISQQELELSAKDQVLRSKEERIQSLEHEAAELRRSMAMMHSAKAAAETEVQRLRAAAAAAAAASAAAPLPPSLPLVTAATATPAPAPPAPPPAAMPPPHSLTAPPAAVFASNPATVGAARQAPAAVPAPPRAPPPPPPPRVPEIVVSYRSSWPDVFLHFNVEGRGWTAVPGMKMEHSGNKEYTMRLQGRSMEFVLTNGQGEWDSPAGGGPGRNYRIDAPGEYRLHYGAVNQVKAWQP